MSKPAQQPQHSPLSSAVTELREQLATERETKEKAIEAWGNRNLKLTKELAAAKAEDTRLADQNVILHDKLDAAVEALGFYCEQTDDGRRAKAALAKIREEK